MLASLSASVLTATLLQWVGGNVIPSGGIYLMDATSCPSGSTEVSAFDGKFLRGTLNAHGDIGGTGGSDTVSPVVSWPAGVPVASGAAVADHAAHTHSVTSNVAVANHTFTQPTVAWPIGVPTAANESSHTHSVTAAGTNGTVSFTPAGTNAATATTGNCAATNVAIGTGATNACKATAPNLTVPAETFTGSAGTVSAETFTGSAVTSGAGSAHTHVLSWPAGVPTNASGAVDAHAVTNNAVTSGNPSATLTHSVTQPIVAWPAGVPTNSAADNKPAFVKVIFCKKD